MSCENILSYYGESYHCDEPENHSTLHLDLNQALKNNKTLDNLYTKICVNDFADKNDISDYIEQEDFKDYVDELSHIQLLNANLLNKIYELWRFFLNLDLCLQNC